jgi:hypothetical protein
MPSTNGHGPKRAILYARVSSDDQVRGYSLDQQIRALQEWASAEGYEVLEEVRDELIPASEAQGAARGSLAARSRARWLLCDRTQARRTPPPTPHPQRSGRVLW